MRLFLLTGCLLLASISCRPSEKPLPQSATPREVVEGLPTPHSDTDPEPPDAQARAEAVAGAEFNRNKTTHLQMSMTTIVGRTSELEGFASALVPHEATIDQKLQRLAAQVTETEVVIQLPGAILFDFDSAQIRPDAERALRDVSDVIRSYTAKPVRIVGHTDSVADDAYNQGLSERRAESVAAWLATHGIEKGRLTASGKGESHPVASNDTSDGRQKNRRVEVVITRR